MVLEIKGFQVLPLALPKSKEDGVHYMYFKKHEQKGGQSGNRSIFLVNVPIETNTSVVKRYLQEVAIGATLESYVPSLLTDSPEDIHIDLTSLTSDLKVSGKDEQYEVSSKLPKNCGIITFIDKPAFQIAFNSLKKLASDSKVSKWPLPALGSSHFLSNLQAQLLEPSKLSKDVASALVEFNRAEKESAESLQQQTELVDEDGFTLVVGSHRKTKAGIMGKQKLASTTELEKAQSKLKKKEKQDFYRYQLRQRKKEEMNDLLSKFRLDQERVKQMKEKKRFKPY
ncbi:hypothetical protein HYPBUDRAFT_112218 [Hyphopichia burtonii NRRL Y-1933]|uniref:Ribosomal RNA-processing protein 7 n=1 Tax=Hyphopichia burtonii NRRL Y-1933 TaxID=984485 RepID=A0A1E4RG47_9ASCO|nr:hypothetical protein HYPBUDRAFT_112218 [Hyphopichia burtonii NRRL Y-1933]ODV66237.1 hypothetical protein HYPBUDRAFT_112218 [Hyphopichia burtonii NRRL Y-1933]